MIEQTPNRYRQGIDIYKQQILIPHLADLISTNMTGNIKMVDFGTGDSSAIAELVNTLALKNIPVSHLLLLETDTTIFPQLIGNILQKEKTNTIISDYTINHGFHLLPNPSDYEGKYDIALSQMVFHQIESDEFLSLMLFRLSQALTDYGKLFIVDINSYYIQNLLERNSAKYEKIDERHGTYVFSDGTKIAYTNRTVEDVLGLCIGTGIASAARVHQAGVKNKPLSESLSMLLQGYPLSSILEIDKAPKSNMTFFEGILDKVKQISYNQFEVSFSDGSQYTLPLPGITKYAQEGDFIVASETELYNKDRYLNVWIINSDKVSHGYGRIFLK